MSDDSEKVAGMAIMSMARDIDELKAEIERLRHEVKLREQICADATLYARRLQEADDEIERLRELLQWWLDAGPDADWDDYEKRVREALGGVR